jgi:hypothetical protein
MKWLKCRATLIEEMLGTCAGDMELSNQGLFERGGWGV